MKVFISSVIRGLQPFRDAVARAASVLRHEVKRSEDFGASTDTPQQACLAGVRWADVVVLLLGARYGDRQPSGISATHEEYQEAKSRCPVLVFVQRDVEREAAQQEFVEEVRSWSGGVLTGDFATPEDLHDAVTRALHELELTHQAGPVDEGELVERAHALIPDRYGFQRWVDARGIWVAADFVLQELFVTLHEHAWQHPEQLLEASVHIGTAPQLQDTEEREA